MYIYNVCLCGTHRIVYAYTYFFLLLSFQLLAIRPHPHLFGLYARTQARMVICDVIKRLSTLERIGTARAYKDTVAVVHNYSECVAIKRWKAKCVQAVSHIYLLMCGGEPHIYMFSQAGVVHVTLKPHRDGSFDFLYMRNPSYTYIIWFDLNVSQLLYTYIVIVYMLSRVCAFPYHHIWIFVEYIWMSWRAV